MTSLKRFRQHCENNAAARFRDLPPRFKRQKSQSSPKSLTNLAFDSHGGMQAQKSRKPDNKCALSSKTAIQRLKSQEEPSMETSGHDQESQAFVWEAENPGAGQLKKWLTMPPLNQEHAVLSPMDNKLFSFYRNESMDESQNEVPDDQKFSVPTGESEFSRISDSVHLNNSNNDVPVACYDENFSHQGHSYLPENGISFNHRAPNQNKTLPSPTQKKASEKEPNVDYTDPDIRTIEMLRELERVADVKETETDESNTDRKSLVSHHLRMLMCAMDRYVGEDEDSFNGRGDETFVECSTPSPPKTSTSGSPPPATSTSYGQTHTEKFPAQNIPVSVSSDGSPHWSHSGRNTPSPHTQVFVTSPSQVFLPSQTHPSLAMQNQINNRYLTGSPANLIAVHPMSPSQSPGLISIPNHQTTPPPNFGLVTHQSNQGRMSPASASFGQVTQQPNHRGAPPSPGLGQVLHQTPSQPNFNQAVNHLNHSVTPPPSSLRHGEGAHMKTQAMPSLNWETEKRNEALTTVLSGQQGLASFIWKQNEHCGRPNAKPWDLWSSPSIDVSHIYRNLAVCESKNDLTENSSSNYCGDLICLEMPSAIAMSTDNRDRKPLYKR